MSLPEVVVGPDTVILGIETSCDETAAAVVMGGDDVVSSVVSIQPVSAELVARNRGNQGSPADCGRS